MIQTKLTLNPILWKQINYHKEVEKLMYQDGFHKTKNHGLWKLRTKLNNREWGAIKHLFSFYDKTSVQKNIIKNMKYYGWATVNPVEVIKILYQIRNT